MGFSAACALVITGALVGLTGAARASAQSVSIPAGVPLRVQVDHRYRVKAGRAIEGRLIAPVYLVDHQVLPAGTRVQGTILGVTRPPDANRLRSMLDGDFVPAQVPRVTFNALQLPDGQHVVIHTDVVQRDARVVKMTAQKQKHSGITKQVRAQIQARKREALDTLHHPNLGDRLEKWLYGQLPWSPMTIWTGTQYDADLTEAVGLPEKEQAPLPEMDLRGAVPTGTVEARLITSLDSAKDRHGTPVTAVLTRPLLSPDGKKVIYPEGAELHGLVTLAEPARWFARNGKLRFTFRSIETEQNQPQTIHGQLAASETSSKENVKISDEGTAESKSGPGKYLAPMVLGAMTTSAFDSDATSNPVHSGVTSNGFGFAARVMVMVSANAVLLRSIAVFAVSKSVYYRWIARGHEVEFPKDTRLEILLNKR